MRSILMFAGFFADANDLHRITFFTFETRMNVEYKFVCYLDKESSDPDRIEVSYYVPEENSWVKLNPSDSSEDKIQFNYGNKFFLSEEFILTEDRLKTALIIYSKFSENKKKITGSYLFLKELERKILKIESLI